MIKTLAVGDLIPFQGELQFILDHFPKHQFGENFAIFRAWEYMTTYARLVQLMGFDNEFTMVDIGSCRSWFPYYIAMKFPKATVYMTDMKLIDKHFQDINVETPPQPPNLHFRVADVMNLSHSFEPNSISVITCLSVIEHVDDETKAYQEMMKVLVRAGVLLMTTDIDYTDESQEHGRRYDLYKLYEAMSCIKDQAYIPSTMDVLNEEQQVERRADNIELYSSLRTQIQDNFWCPMLHYLAGQWEIVKT